MTVAYVGLGSNLGDREALIRRAADVDRRSPAVGDPRDGAVGQRPTSRSS